MKTIQVKKLAAIAGGAALMATALAPMAAAAVSLQKNDVFADSGAPLVDIVVGANAHVSDAVVAGNIAAAIAKKAYVEKNQDDFAMYASVSGSGGSAGSVNVSNAKVKLTVGGTVTMGAGSREFFSSYLDSTSGTAKEVADQNIGTSTFAVFSNGTKNYRIGSTSSTYTNTEEVRVSLDARFDTYSEVKDLVGYIDSGDLRYVSKMTAISDINSTATFNAGSSDYVPISFLGKNYLISQVTSNSAILLTDNPETRLSSGESVDVVGVDGKTYQLVFTGGGQNSSSQNVADFSLELDGQSVATLTSQQGSTSGTVLTFRQGAISDLLTTRVVLKEVRKETQNSSDVYRVILLIGNERVEIRNGQRFPYDPNNTSGSYQWSGFLTFGGSGTALTEIGIQNSTKKWTRDTDPLVADGFTFDESKGVAAATLFEGASDLSQIGSVKFRGFYTAGGNSTAVKVETGTETNGDATMYGKVSYTNANAVPQSFPFAIKLNKKFLSTPESGTFTFGGVKYAYSIQTIGSTEYFILNYDNDTNALQSFSDVATKTTYGDKNILLPSNLYDLNYTKPVILRNVDGTDYYYLVKRYRTGGVTDKIWLVLAGRDDANNSGDADFSASTGYYGRGTNAGLIDSLQWNAGRMIFVGTDLDEATVSTISTDFNAKLGTAAVPWYHPDVEDFNGVLPASSNTAHAYKTAIFVVKEGLGGDSVGADANGFSGVNTSTNSTNGGAFVTYLDTENGFSGTVETANNSKTGYAGKATAIDYNGTSQDLSTLSEYTGSSSNYTKAWTDWGSAVFLADSAQGLDTRELLFVLPNARAPTYVTVESEDAVEVQTGGKDFEVTNGESQTVSGTTVTISEITGATVGGGADGNAAISWTPFTVREMVASTKPRVYTDSMASSGTFIIVGGPLVNSLAAELTDAPSFQSAGAAEVKKYAASDGSEHILVAGYTKEETAQAGQELIDWINSQ